MSEMPDINIVEEWKDHPVTRWLRAITLEVQEDKKIEALKKCVESDYQKAAYLSGVSDGINEIWAQVEEMSA